MQKILIIGQAPPAVKQEYPYDTTMLYDWLKKCDITKEQAQEMFDFEAIYDKFPGYNDKGGHKAPSQEQMDEHWPVLEQKILNSLRVIILGNVAKDYISTKHFFVQPASKVLYLMHPSKMNYNRYIANKDKVINPLKKFLCT